MSTMISENFELSEIKSIELEIKNIESEIEKLTAKKQILVERKEKIKEDIQKRKSEKLAKRDWSTKTFSWSKKVEKLLEDVFKIKDFRPFQLEVINATLSKEDVLLIMPTGGGKSLCYQLPALVDKGVTIVVSPLVSLMEDQIMALKRINYPAVMVSAKSSKEDSKIALDALKDSSSKIKLIYVTPEKLAKSKRFMSMLQKCHEQGRFARLAIDEVHCCSVWGHDFRPDYGYLEILKDMFPGVPLLGLTATSTSKVTADVQKMLNIKGCLIMKATFNRPNLYYEVIPKPSSQNDVLKLLEKWLKGKFKNKSGIIYTTVIKDCEELTKELRKREIKAGVYHAMLDASVRSKMHAKWVSGEYQVVVATVAFGMGIDKPDVGFVIHHSLSKSMENFYQESGRAGRNGEKSMCIVMYRLADVFKLSTMVFTQQTGLENLYGMLNYCLDPRSCRRSLIAQYFDEACDSKTCSKMCDNCRFSNKIKEMDLAPHCRCLYRIIDRGQEIEMKLTALKLLDAWFSKGDSKLRISTKCPFDRVTAESVLGHLLVKGYLKEEFHYTAYSCISYIKKGSKCGLLDDSCHRIVAEFGAGEKEQSGTQEKSVKKEVISSDDEVEVVDLGVQSKSNEKKVKKELINLDDEIEDDMEGSKKRKSETNENTKIKKLKS